VPSRSLRRFGVGPSRPLAAPSPGYKYAGR